ncbi:MAG: 1,4-dihydroxy-2-naphthoyl-CoA synthase, partial [Microbacterium sp.]
MVSELFDESEWMPAPGADAFTDITAHVSHDGHIARIALDRPEVRNAFRPHTVDELYRALDAAR